MTYADMKAKARALGTCLRKVHGIGQREKIAIWAGNSTDWIIADQACAAFNFTSVSVYDTLGPDAASFIIADSGAQVVVVEAKTLQRLPDALEDEVYAKNPGGDVKVVVYFGKGDLEAKATLEKKGIAVISIDDAIREHLAALVPDTPPTPKDVVTLMNTSGTTGNPKGVMILHSNVVASIGMLRCTPSVKLKRDDVHLSYLPLAHIFERSCVAALLYCGAVVSVASNGSKALLADLSVIKPTMFLGVPKVYENVRDAVQRKMVGFKKTLFERAMAAKIADLDTGCGYSKIWDILVFSKTKLALGGRVRFCVTGGAPISKETLQFVQCALGSVVQGYGATETYAVSSLTMTFARVGPPSGSVAFRLVDVPEMNYFSGPEDEYRDKARAAFDSGKNKYGGEVWIGGSSVTAGYCDPSVNGLKPGLPTNGMKKKTDEDFFKEGNWWFKTGDIGLWDERGCMKIVDRRKNLFKTSLGEYVPVEEVEKSYQDLCSLCERSSTPTSHQCSRRSTPTGQRTTFSPDLCPEFKKQEI